MLLVFEFRAHAKQLDCYVFLHQPPPLTLLPPQQMAEKRRMQEAAENFEEYEPESPPPDEDEQALVQQDIFVHCVRNRKAEHVPLHIFLRLPGQFLLWIGRGAVVWSW